MNGRKIPTDGLVLRGFYNAITLAVYGTLSKSTAEQLAQAAQQQNVSGNMDHSQSTSALDNQVSCTSSAQMVENHVDSIAGTRQSFGPFFKNIFKKPISFFELICLLILHRKRIKYFWRSILIYVAAFSKNTFTKL